MSVYTGTTCRSLLPSSTYRTRSKASLTLHSSACLLARMGVNDDFYAFVQQLYTDSSMALQVNDENMAPFRVSAGLRQTNPLSPFLVDLAMEPLVRRAARLPEYGIQLG